MNADEKRGGRYLVGPIGFSFLGVPRGTICGAVGGQNRGRLLTAVWPPETAGGDGIIFNLFCDLTVLVVRLAWEFGEARRTLTQLSPMRREGLGRDVYDPLSGRGIRGEDFSRVESKLFHVEQLHSDGG